MSGSGRCRVLLALVAPAAAAMALSASTASALAADNPLTLSVAVGYHNAVKLGAWMPVAVDITNSGPDFEGTLEVQADYTVKGPPVGTAIYQSPVSLAAGATKHFRTYVTQDAPGAVTARLVQNGREVASKRASPANWSSGLLLGILSDQPTTLDAMRNLHPTGIPPVVVHLASSDLPDSVPVLRAFDVIAIDDFSTDTLTAAQKTALDDYVMQGGSLLLGTGGSWRKTLAGLPAGLVPMQVGGSTLLGSVGALGGASNVEIATGAKSEGASTWLSDGSQPLLVEAQSGRGMVMLATFDWNQDSITGWSGFNSVLRQAVVRLTYGRVGNTTSAVAMSGVGSSASIGSKGGALAGALANLPALDLPAWWLIGALVFVYVLLVGPVNYFVLRAVGRRALAWITVPAIALVASAGAYGTSVVTKGTSVLANEVSVIHVQPGSDRAYQEEYTGIMAPTRGDYQVGIGGGRMLISPIYYYTGNTGTLRIYTAGSDVMLPGMTAFTLRAFAAEGVLAAAPAISGQVKLSGGTLGGTIQNSSTLDFTDGVVISGNSFQKLGEVRPGASASFTIPQSISSGFTGMPLSMRIYPTNNQFSGVPPNNASDAEREAQTRSGVLSTLIPNPYAALPATGQPLVVLWTRLPFQSVTVNGAHPRTYVESAIVLTLRLQEVGAGAIPTGVIQGRMVDLDAQTNGGPPGTVVAQSGTMTYSFDVALAPGKHLTAASITDTNPYGAKALAGGPSPSSPVKAELWDWGHSTWIGVTYRDTNATTVPDSAVNPESGQVLVRLTSDGPFVTGSLSLAGTVA